MFARKKSDNRPRWGAKGYSAVSVDGVEYLAHRIIWKMVMGDEPMMLDHINGDRGDNRLANLRVASCAENIRNSKRSKASRSGVKGVSFCKMTGQWRASITLNRKASNLGRYGSLEEAAQARKAAAALMHGDFARAA